MNSKELIIFHGTKGSPEGNWFPWLQEVAQKYGHTVSIPKFPTPEEQSLKTWLEAYGKTRQLPAGHPSIIIGHSIGATFALRLLERNLDGPRDATFLVSGLVGPLEKKEETQTFNKLNQSFYEEQFRWDRISQSSKKFFVYHGTDDPFVPMHHADVIANGLGKDVEVTKIRGGGHINEESGFTKFERLWQDLKPLLDENA